MSIPSRERSRGCSSQFLLPLEHEDLAKARNLYINIMGVNIVGELTEVRYIKKCKDFHKRVYRWDTRHYNEIFKEGFKARPQVILPTPVTIILRTLFIVDVLLLIFHPADMLLCVQLVTVLGHQRLPVSSSQQTRRLNIIDMKYSS